VCAELGVGGSGVIGEGSLLKGHVGDTCEVGSIQHPEFKVTLS
jgi:hypothetical protein